MSTVEKRISLVVTRVNGELHSQAVTTHWSYDSATPLQVTVTFEDKDPHSWVFARSVLADGLHGAGGLGDISIHLHGGDMLELNFTSRDGSCSMHGDRRPFLDFYRDTVRLVRPSAERVDFDTELDELLRSSI